MRSAPRFIASIGLALVSGAACQSLEFDQGEESGGGGGYIPDLSSGTGDPPPPIGTGGQSQPLSQTATSDLEGPAPSPPDLFEYPGCVSGGDDTKTEVRRSLASSLGTSSATWARAMLRAGRRPDSALLRVDDFLALYVPPPADEAGRVALHLRALGEAPSGEGGGGGAQGSGGAGGEVKPSEGGGGAAAGTKGWDPIDVIARVDTPRERAQPLRIVLLVDVSPSMRAVAPLVGDVVDAFASGLGHAEDALAVVSFAGDAKVEVPLGPVAEVSPTIAALELPPRPGGDLSVALTTAYSLHGPGEPLHVVLLTDGSKRFDDALVTQVSNERTLGAQLSVALFGKPTRFGVDPTLALAFPQGFSETLAQRGGGQAHYFAEVADVTDVLGGRGIDRRFGLAFSAGALSVSLGRYLRLEVPEASSGDPSTSTNLAPGWSYGFHVPGSVCSAEALESSPQLLLGEARVALEGAQPGELLFEATTSTGLDVALDATDWVEAAVVSTVGVLRGADPVGALARLDAVEAELGCTDDPEARGCPALEDLRELVLLHGAAAPSEP